VCSWSYQKPLDTVAAEMKKIGLKNIHLALQPFLDGDERHGAAESKSAQAAAVERIKSGEWKVTSTMLSFSHEDYTTPATIRATGGIVPDKHWEGIKKTIVRAAKLTAEWKVPFMSMHAGFLDESNKEAFAKFVERLTWIRDTCKSHGVKLTLESGQETAEDLAKFMGHVDGIGINFDTANTLAYGDDAVEVFKKVFDQVVTLHINDCDAKGSLKCVVAGTVAAPIQEILEYAKKIGWNGWVCIEEAGFQGLPGIKQAVDYVNNAWNSID
jgi:sugar phosphate isomerase/epimerase